MENDDQKFLPDALANAQKAISKAMRALEQAREMAGRSPMARHLSIAITDLEGVEDRVKRAALYIETAE